MKNQKKINKKTTKTSKPTKGVLAYHIAKSLVSVTSHPHTGRAIHPRHTSHGVLLIALVLTGILLFSNMGALRAYGVVSGGSRTITVNIAGNPPTVGAQITFPQTKSTTKSSQVQVAGTCEASTLVATYKNGSFAGSSVCSSSGDFATVVQLAIGTNLLQSQNYDALNQPGPVTDQIQIIREHLPAEVMLTASIPTIATTAADITSVPSIPSATPAPQPVTAPCYTPSNGTSATSTDPAIVANCIHRDISVGQKVTVPIRVTGGDAPYALSINWGDDLVDLKSVNDSAFYNYDHIYKTSGVHNVGLKITDSKGASSFLQTVVQVNGNTTAGTGSTSTFGAITAGIGSIWTEVPVPLYWAAVTLVLGFWVGDIFQRIFAKKRPTAKRRSTKLNTRRHA